MDNSFIEEDLSLVQNNEIIERTVIFDNKTKTFNFSSPKKIKYKKRRQFQCLELIKQLVSSANLLEFPNETLKLEGKNSDSGIASLTCSNEVRFVREEPSSWEPPKLTLGKMYLVPMTQHKTKWIKAELVEISSSGLFKLINRKNGKIMLTTCIDLAYPENPEYLNVGSRVIGYANQIKSTGEIRGRRKMLGGIVCENPSSVNKNRYLVIFDDGCWQYVDKKKLWAINFQSSNIWSILSDTTSYTVQQFLDGKFEINFNYVKGDRVKCRIGEFGVLYGLVMHVDCSLILIWLEKLSSSKWMHKGCPFLKKCS